MFLGIGVACAVALFVLADTSHGANLPDCPSDWPVVESDDTVLETDYGGGSFEGFHTDSNGDEWYIIRSVDDNGYSLVRAYPASDQHDSGYVTDQPSKVCYLIVRGPDETEDRDPPTQIDFPNESEPDISTTTNSGSSQNGTGGTPGTGGTGGSGTGGGGTGGTGGGGTGGGGSGGTGGGGTGGGNWPGSGQYPGCGNAAMGSSGTPGTPTAPTLTGTVVATSIGVAWTAPANNGNPILHYAIMYTAQGGSSTKVSAGGDSEIVTGLSLGTTYEVRVAACNSVGFGPWSGGATITTSGTSGAGGTGVTVGSTPNNGCGIAGRGTDGTPAAPTQPSVERRMDTQAFVEWTAPDNGGSPILDYSIKYTPSGGTGTEVSGNGVSEIITGLTAGTEYLIQVAACNAAGWGDWSPGTILSGTASSSNNGNNGNNGNTTTCGDAAPGSTGTPDAPTVPTLTTPTTTSIGVTWTAPNQGSSAIIRYAIHYLPEGGSSSWTDATGTSATLTGLTADTQYHVRVAACNATGYSDWSPTASTPASANGNGGNGNNGNNGNNGGNSNNGGGTNTVISECGDANRGSNGTPDRPLAPSLIVTQDNTRVGVEWVAPADNGSDIIGYSIMYVPTGGTRAVVNAGGSSAILQGLSANTVYEISVSACNGVGFGNWSPGATITTQNTGGTPGTNSVGNTNNAWCGVAMAGSTGTPGTPNPPTQTSKTDTSITVSWTAPSNSGESEIKMYAVQWTHNGTSQMEKVMTGMSYTIAGLEADTPYTVAVAACNAVGMSSWSPSLVVRTEPGTAQSNVVPQSEPASNDSNGDGDGASGASDDADEDRDPYDIVVYGTCSAGEWQGHTHTNTVNYWGGTVGCLAEDLIDSIDPADDVDGRGRMWTKSKMHDHKHPGFTDATHSGNSCNAQHVAAHANHTPLSCSSQ